MPYKADAPAWCLVCGGRGVPTGAALDSRAAVGYCSPPHDGPPACKAPVLITFDPAQAERSRGERVVRNTTRAHARHKPERPNGHCRKCYPVPTSSGHLTPGNAATDTMPVAAATGRSPR